MVVSRKVLKDRREKPSEHNTHTVGDDQHKFSSHE